VAVRVHSLKTDHERECSDLIGAGQFEMEKLTFKYWKRTKRT